MKRLFCLFAAVALLGAIALPACADTAGKDCAPIGHLPNYHANGAAELFVFKSAPFDVNKPGGGYDTIQVAGTYCRQTYDGNEGAQPSSDQEVQENFRYLFKQLGVQTTYTDEDETEGKLVKGGTTMWIHVHGGQAGWEVITVTQGNFKPTILPATAKDCVPIGSLPNYHANGAAELFVFKSAPFDVNKPGGGYDTIQVAGTYCRQTYDGNEGAQPSSDQEVQDNFRYLFKQLGVQTTYTDDDETEGKLVKDGTTTWIHVHGGQAGWEVTTVTPRDFKPTILPATAKDCAPIGSLPNYHPNGAQERLTFKSAPFDVNKPGGGYNTIQVSGAYCHQSYDGNDGAQPSSDLEVQDNFHYLFKQLGVQTTYTDDDETEGKLVKDGATTWIHVHGGQAGWEVTTVTVGGFKPSILPAEASTPKPAPASPPPPPASTPKPIAASEMKAALNQTGHIALYINFDFNRASLRPDAAPTIAQVVKLLQDDPGLKLSVEGNTDNVGGHDYNVLLSQARAQTVVAALVKAGIAADRLHSSGNGPDKPIASNSSEAGRAKNRRVELVKL